MAQLMMRAKVEAHLREAEFGRWEPDNPWHWHDVYEEDVQWLLSQIDRLETERQALADVIAEELVG